MLKLYGYLTKRKQILLYRSYSIIFYLKILLKPERKKSFKLNNLWFSTGFSMKIQLLTFKSVLKIQTYFKV